MQIGDVIRKYRLEKHMTQEEVARRLGVTAPAVNKWEKGISMPDIMLLSPVARLLDITLDTLLSHTDTLSDEQANQLIEMTCDKLKIEAFEEVFAWAKKQLQSYPNSAYFALHMARILENHLQMQDNKVDETYTSYFLSCYQRALESENEGLRSSAADALYYHYMDSKQYDKAEEYLDYFSAENPERKRKLAAVYRKMGRKDEALRMYEELLYVSYQIVNSTFHDIYISALEDDDFKRAHQMVEKQERLAQLFEMGLYHEVSPGLELAILEQDADTLFTIMQQLLHHIESIYSFTQSTLYSHMTFQRQPDETYFCDIRQTLLDCLKDEQCAFVKEDARFYALLTNQK